MSLDSINSWILVLLCDNYRNIGTFCRYKSLQASLSYFYCNENFWIYWRFPELLMNYDQFMLAEHRAYRK